MWVMIPLILISAALLAFPTIGYLNTEAMTATVAATVAPYISYVAYGISAYTLTVWCVRIPRLIASAKRIKQENPLARRWFGDVRFRVNVTLFGSVIWNTAYAVFQLGLGLIHRTLWYISVGVYYLFLAVMRLFLVRHSRKHSPGERMLEELRKYRACGWSILIMNFALAVMIVYVVYLNHTFIHHQVVTIAMATYTFTTFTFALVNLVRYRKYQSPIYSASKAISLAAASVSMLTLTSTMLTTFGEMGDADFRRIMLSLVGGGVLVFVIGLAVYMITRSTKEIRRIRATTATNATSATNVVTDETDADHINHNHIKK